MSIRGFLDDAAYRLSVFLHPAKPRVKSWGSDFPDKRFLLASRRGFGPGIFSYMQSALGWIAYARANDMIPVIGMCDHPSIYHAPGEVGRVNVWDEFFSQPDGVNLEHIRRAKCVAVATESWMPDIPNFMPSIGHDEDIEQCTTLMAWRKLCHETLKPKEENLRRFESKELEQALPQGVLGVLARGTDYVRLRPNGHPIQPTADMLIQAVESRLTEGREHKVFLATEDAAIAEDFRRAFPDRLILSNQDFVEYKGGYIGKTTELRGSLTRGLAYMKAMVDLSRCRSFIGGRTSGTVGVALLSQGFEFSKAFNLGVYHT